MQRDKFIYGYWMRDVLNRIVMVSDDIITCTKDSLGQNSVFICFFLSFPYFLKFSSTLINVQIR